VAVARRFISATRSWGSSNFAVSFKARSACIVQFLDRQRVETRQPVKTAGSKLRTHRPSRRAADHSFARGA
jgi:hypothetical protein